jgi:hypothetical protein
MHPLSPSPTPSHVRWRILFLLLLISIITYIDRVNISVTARQMMPTLGLTDLQMGQIFSAFVLGYALFQIPGGWLGDRWGPRRVLTFAVIWWSIFTALTAVAPTLPLANLIGIMGSLMVVRFLIGIGEAAALPNFNRAVANWHPPHERGLGIGITIGGIGIGSALTPPVTAWIMVNYGWQTAFYVAGGLGIGIALLWYWYATDHPRQHPHVNSAEADLIEGSKSPTGLPAPLHGRAGKAWGMVHDSFADLEKSDWLHPASPANGNGNGTGDKKGSTTPSTPTSAGRKGEHASTTIPDASNCSLESHPHHTHRLVAHPQLHLSRLRGLRVYVLVLSLSRQCKGVCSSPRRLLRLGSVHRHGHLLSHRGMGDRSSHNPIRSESGTRQRGSSRDDPGRALHYRRRKCRSALCRHWIPLARGRMALFHRGIILGINHGLIQTLRRHTLRHDEHRRQLRRHPLAHTHSLAGGHLRLVGLSRHRCRHRSIRRTVLDVHSSGTWFENGQASQKIVNHNGSVEKSRQRRSRHFSVLTYSAYAPRVKMAAALLDGLF